jgi:hypothetical protein
MLPGNALFDPEIRILLTVLFGQIAPERDAAHEPEEDRPNRLLSLARSLRPAHRARPSGPRVTGETEPVRG